MDQAACEKPEGRCYLYGVLHAAAEHPARIDASLRGRLPVYADGLGVYCRIPLTRGHYAKVDPEDYGWLSQFRWHYVRSGRTYYAVRSKYENGRGGKVWMHREIMNTPRGLVCDHINHNGLDNRTRNLRNCTTAQNNCNRRRFGNARSRYRGVFWSKEMQMWAAAIGRHGQTRHLGYFLHEMAAARAYDVAARRLHGAYACLNFPEEAAAASLRFARRRQRLLRPGASRERQGAGPRPITCRREGAGRLSRRPTLRRDTDIGADSTIP